MRSLAAVALAATACGSRAPTATSTARKPVAADERLYYEYVDVRDRHVCSGLPAAEATCKSGGDCKLVAPVAYWDGPPRCSGVRPENEDAEAADDERRIASLPTPACVCSCDPAYIAARDERNAELDRCSDVP